MFPDPAPSWGVAGNVRGASLASQSAFTRSFTPLHTFSNAPSSMRSKTAFSFGVGSATAPVRLCEGCNGVCAPGLQDPSVSVQISQSSSRWCMVLIVPLNLGKVIFGCLQCLRLLYVSLQADGECVCSDLRHIYALQIGGIPMRAIIAEHGCVLVVGIEVHFVWRCGGRGRLAAIVLCGGGRHCECDSDLLVQAMRVM